MRRALLAALLFALALPGAAHATLEEDFDRYLRVASPAAVHAAAAPKRAATVTTPGGEATKRLGTQTGAGTVPSRGRDRTACVRHAERVLCTTYRRGRIAQRCIRRTFERACRTYDRQGRATRRCVERPDGTRRRCKRLTRARAASLQWDGWPPTVKSIGKLLAVRRDGTVAACSAVVVDRDLLLTAGHCLYGTDVGDATRVLFAPGMSSPAPRAYATPHGVWEGSRWTVPAGYRANADPSLDFGLVRVAPRGGRTVGQAVPSFSVTALASWSQPRRVFAIGYPAAGTFMAEGSQFGLAQYGCDATYEGRRGPIGSGWEAWFDCPMTAGASGGPVFIQRDGGAWTVGGLVSQCARCLPTADLLGTPFFDQRFVDFWNGAWTNV